LVEFTNCLDRTDVADRCDNGFFAENCAFGDLARLLNKKSMPPGKVAGTKEDTMSDFNLTAIQRSVVAMFAALVFSTACIAAAVGPASAGQLEQARLVSIA
jgi:hypothetical protein